MSIENTLERIAVALEKLVEVKSNPVFNFTPTNAQTAANPLAVTATTMASAPAPEADAFAERDAIKAELTKLGVPFNNKARTEVLKTLLETSKAQPAETPQNVAPSAPEEPATPTQAAVEPSISLDVVREAVKKFAAIAGAPKAIALLAKYKANKVSDLAPDTFQSVMDAVSKELN